MKQKTGVDLDKNVIETLDSITKLCRPFNVSRSELINVICYRYFDEIAQLKTNKKITKKVRKDIVKKRQKQG